MRYLIFFCLIAWIGEGIDHIYVINLKERPERWEYTQKVFQGFEIERFEAINGWKLSADQKAALFGPHPVRLNGGQIGCLLSHIAIYRDALEKGYQTVWICEDDVTLSQDVSFLDPLLQKLSALDPEWDIFYTDFRDEKVHFPDPRPRQEPYAPLFSPVDEQLVRILGRHRTHSMIFSRRGLQKAVDYFRQNFLWSPIDVDLHQIPHIREYSATWDIATSTRDFVSDTEPCSSFNTERPFVTVHLMGQLGNNLFQVATASALAWDHGVELSLSEMWPISNLHHVFFRCSIKQVHPSSEWKEPDLAYHPIPYTPNMKLIGYFQSEKYFAHHRERLLELFAPSVEDQAYMEKKYGWLIHSPNTVGVQIRDYKYEDPNQGTYPQYGKDYLEQAMRYFPESTLFVVSSNNLEYARSSIPSWVKRVVFLENNPPYIDLFLLSLCKHNIISNSSFGWWAAWLNQNPDKKVLCPLHLFNGLPYQDYCPTEWIRIDALAN